MVWNKVEEATWKGLGVNDKKLRYRWGTAQCVVSIEILPIATQQSRNYLYDNNDRLTAFDPGQPG